jgi:hypothetical protein
VEHRNLCQLADQVLRLKGKSNDLKQQTNILRAGKDEFKLQLENL